MGAREWCAPADRVPVVSPGPDVGSGRRLESGTIWVDPAPAGECGRAVVHARVCAHDRRVDLDRQVVLLTEWATGNGHAVGEVVREVGPLWTGSARSCGASCRTRLRVWWSWRIVTGWPGSGSSTWRRRWRRRVAGSSWPIPLRGPMT